MASHLHLCAAAIFASSLAACASVSVIPLDYNGQPKPEAAGIRYYMPKPYLLVTQIKTPTGGKPPPGGANNKTSTATATCNGTTATATCDGGDKNAQPAAAANTTQNQSDATNKAGSSPSPSSDLSYQLSTTYLLKLIYLPDMSKQMAINVVPGIFGTSSAQPNLQDGWMLTSLQASSDNTKALDDLTSLATALLGAGGKAATGGATAKTAAQARAKDMMGQQPPGPAPLAPGLYEFRYDEFGHLIGLCRLTSFDASVQNDRLLPSDFAGALITGNYCQGWVPPPPPVAVKG